MGLWSKAKSADSTYSVINWIPTTLQYLFPAAWGALVAYLAAIRDGFLQGYGLLGVAVVATVAALAASSIFALSGIGAHYWRGRQEKPTTPTAISKDATDPPDAYEKPQEYEKQAEVAPQTAELQNRIYTSTDKELLSEFFQKLSRALNGTMNDALEDGVKLVTEWDMAATPPPPLPRLIDIQSHAETLSPRFDEAVKSIDEFRRTLTPRFPKIVARLALPERPFENLIGKYGQLLMYMRLSIIGVRRNTDPSEWGLLPSLMERREFKEAAGEVQKWVETFNQRLEAEERDIFR